MSNNFINDVIRSLESIIGSLNTEIATLEETYRKKLEEAKAALTEQLEETQAQYDYWLGVRGDKPAPEKKTRRSRKTKSAEEIPQEPPKQVVDTIFPENNEPEGAAEPEQTVSNVEPIQEVPFTESKPVEQVPLAASEVPFPDNMESLWPAEEAPIESEDTVAPEEENPFGDFQDDSSKDEPIEDEDLGSEDWPDEIEEWKN